MAAGRKRNVYGGTCRVCGEHVGQYQGTVEKVDGKWTVEHDRCPAAEEAQRAIEKAERDRVFAAALDAIAAADLTPTGLVELRILRAGQHNPYMAGYLRIVETADSMATVDERICQASQGMTMDYMTEFANEREAISLAHELAAEKFTKEDAR